MEITNKPAAKDEQSYEDFEPFCQLHKNEGFDVLEIHLPGFKRQEVRVQISNLGILTISGKQAMDDQTTSICSRFRKEIKVSKKCDTNAIRAKFSRGILCITMPKKVPNSLSTHEKAEHSKESAPSSTREKIKSAENATPSINGYLLGLRSIVLRPKLSKEIALKMVVVALAMALGGYGIYEFSKSATTDPKMN